MEIKSFASFTYFLLLHLYLFYANKSSWSDSVVTAKNNRESHSSTGFYCDSVYIINSTRHKGTYKERQYAKESNSHELFGRKIEGKTKLQMRKKIKRWHQIWLGKLEDGSMRKTCNVTPHSRKEVTEKYEQTFPRKTWPKKYRKTFPRKTWPRKYMRTFPRKYMSQDATDLKAVALQKAGIKNQMSKTEEASKIELSQEIAGIKCSHFKLVGKGE